MKLHAVAGSRSFRIEWLLAEMGLEAEVVRYRLDDDSLRSDAFRAVNPLGRVPALEVDGHVMIESGAIVEYLCETRPEAGLGRLPGDPERADFLVWLHYAETVANIIQSLNISQIFLPDPRQASPHVIGIETRRLAKALKLVEARLADRPYLLDSGFSAADVMYGFAIEAAFHYVHREKFPALVAYLERLAARPAHAAALAAQGPDTIYTQPFYEVPDG